MATKKTTKVQSEVSQADIDQMSQLSDEKNTKAAPKFSLASLKINGKQGGYYKTVLEGGELATGDDGKAYLEEVKNPVGIILRPRKSFNFIGGDYQLFTSEGGNTPKSVFSVFRKGETKKGFSIQMVGQGTPEQIKAKFPELKMTQVIYFLMDGSGELVRLKVKGMSLGNIFDYWKEFGANEHLFQYKTILGQEKDKNQFGAFIKSTFKKGEKVTDFTQVKKALELINVNIEAIEAYYKERDAEMADYLADKPADFSDDENGAVEKPVLGKGPIKTKPGKDGQMEIDEDEDKKDMTEEEKAATRKMLKEMDEDTDDIDVKEIPFG